MMSASFDRSAAQETVDKPKAADIAFGAPMDEEKLSAVEQALGKKTAARASPTAYNWRTT